MAKFTPFGEQVIIQPNEDADLETKILLLEKPFYAEGTVVSVGPGIRTPHSVAGESFLAPEVKPGDKVIYMRAAGIKFPPAGEGMLLLKASQVLGKVK